MQQLRPSHALYRRPALTRTHSPESGVARSLSNSLTDTSLALAPTLSLSELPHADPHPLPDPVTCLAPSPHLTSPSQELDVSGCRIGDEGGAALCGALAVNAHLLSLNLGWNSLQVCCEH